MFVALVKKNPRCIKDEAIIPSTVKRGSNPREVSEVGVFNLVAHERARISIPLANEPVNCAQMESRQGTAHSAPGTG